MSHPCSASYHQHFSLFLTYCEQLQAWSVQLSSYDESPAEIRDPRHLRIDFGPFDRFEEVRQVVLEHLGHAIGPRGVRPLRVFRVESQGDEGQPDEAPGEESQGQQQRPLFEGGKDY